MTQLNKICLLESNCHVFISYVDYILHGRILVTSGKIPGKDEKVSISFVCDSGGEWRHGKIQESNYLALCLIFSEFITLGKTITATFTLQISHSGKGKYIQVFFFFPVFLSLFYLTLCHHE